MAVTKATLVARAKKLRATPTGAEHHLHYWLQQAGAKGVKRQVVIGRIIVDIAIPSRNLIIEVDGLSHALKRRQDAARDAWLEGCGFRVVRVSNREALRNGKGTATAVLSHGNDTAENAATFKRAMTVANKQTKATETGVAKTELEEREKEKKEKKKRKKQRKEKEKETEKEKEFFFSNAGARPRTRTRVSNKQAKGGPR